MYSNSQIFAVIFPAPALGLALPSLSLLAPSLLVLIAGLLLWSNGYRLLRLSLALAGLWGGFALATMIQKWLDFSGPLFAVLTICLSLGLALLCSLAYRLSFLLGGAALACYLVHHYTQTLFQWEHPAPILVAAGLGAIAGLLFHKPFLIAITSWIGSILILQGVLALAQQQEWLSLTPALLYNRPLTHWVGLLLPILLTVLGARLQLHRRVRL